MRKELKLFHAVTDVEDELVEKAGQKQKRRGLKRWQRWTAFAACLAAVIALAALIPLGKKGEDGALLDVIYPKAYSFDDYEAQQLVREENPVQEDFLAGLTDFSYESASALLSGENGNQNYSPLSLYYALAIAATGAEGDTAEELLSLLGTSDTETLSIQCRNLYRQLYRNNKIGSLELANSLWLDKSAVFEDDFVKNAAENFYATSHSVNLAEEKAGKAMSSWVAEHTKGTIEPQIQLTDESVLEILNTVYFRDQWVDRFDESKTEADDFYLADGTAVTCDFMHMTNFSHGFSKGEGFTRSSLGLKDAGSMIFILPDAGLSPRELLSSPEKMREAFEGGEDGWGEVVWQVPKFSFGTQMDLGNALQALGVTSAFDPEKADFSALSAESAWIGAVRQETHIAIDEIGVEASAFTQIDYCGAAPPEGRADMILNRPFIYAITADNGTLLFVGICENPVL